MLPDTLYLHPVMPQTAETPTISLSATGAQARNVVEHGGTCRPAQAAPKLPHADFRYRGRLWPLSKPSLDPDAAWQIALNDRGRRVRRSLGFATLKESQVRARALVDEFLAGILAPVAPVAPGCSKFADLFAAVDRLDMVADARSRATYVWGAHKFFAFALDRPDVPTLSLEVVNGETGAQFWTRALAHAGSLASQADQQKFKRQARGWFGCCKALFAADAVKSFPAGGLVGPELASIAAFRASKPKRFKVARAGFTAPANAVLRATFRQWLQLGRTPGYAVLGGAGNARKKHELQPLHETARRNMFIAIGLMLACGVRKGEVLQLRWRHLTHDAEGVPRLIARDIQVKKGTGQLEVKPLEPFWSLLRRGIERNGWQGAPDDFILAQRPQTAGVHGGLVFRHGGHCDRTYWPFYHVGKWLRSLGWNLQKTNHALRDCAASFVTMKWGLDRAKLFCRHETRATTEANYSRFVREDLMDNPKSLAWLRWAKGTNDWN